MKLVVGLGNPGPEYARSRHNVGFLVADRLAHALGAEFTVRKFASELAEGRAGHEKVWIMKPQTYMNRSGEAVGPALRFWKLAVDDLVVVHDEIELEPFRVQLKVGGGDSGHNGVRSVNAHLGTREYARVRVGVGRPPGEEALAEADPALHGALDDQVLVAGDLTIDDDGAPDDRVSACARRRDLLDACHVLQPSEEHRVIPR